MAERRTRVLLFSSVRDRRGRTRLRLRLTALFRNVVESYASTRVIALSEKRRM